jgi:parallel beta-helix repeat protein
MRTRTNLLILSILLSILSMPLIASAAATVAADVPPAEKPAGPPPSAAGPALPQPKPEEPKTPARDKPMEFFVDGNSGSDANAGTADKPFKTIGRGVKELRPGDTLIVHGGTYREAVGIELVGTKDRPITVQAAPGQTVVIKGSEVVTGWKRDGNVWRKEGWTKDFVSANFAKGTQLVSPNLLEVYQKDGIRGDAVVLYRVRKPEELREGKCYWDEATGTITIWPIETGGVFDPNANGVEIPVRGPGLSAQKQWVRVRGFQVRQCGMGMITNWPSAGVYGQDCSMEDCIVTWCDFGGLSLSGFRCALRRCEGSYCGDTGMGAGVGEDLLIEDCVVTHNNFWRYSPGWHGGGAKIIPWFNKSTVRNSEFSFNYGPGLWFDGSCNDSLVEGNVCHDNEGPGIMIEISRGNLLRNNICYNNRNGLPGIDLMPLEGKGYSPLVCEARRTEGGSGGCGIFISSSPDTKCYNNLCYHNESPGIFAEWAKRESSDIADWAERKGQPVTMSTHGVDVRNNILVNNGGCQLSVRRNGLDEDTYGNVSDYNLLFDNTGGALVRWGFGGAAFTSLGKWQAASRFDRHSVVAAPTFEFSPGMDLRPQPDSAGVDQGELLPEVPADRLGVKRPQGRAADIGPYEIAGTRRLVERPKVPTNLTYFQVDLSKLVNRAFADEKADDGKGGWSDQGPTTDLRMFPGAGAKHSTVQTFNGVPFRILSPLGCVVLKSGYRPQSKSLPDRVVIPVKHKADVLYFLHSGAWLGNGQPEWTYLIHRGDGTQEEVKVNGSETIRDWSDPNPGLPFDREYPTTTTVAWTGKNQTFDKVSVYMMAWVNHSDWCDVTDVEMIAGPSGGVPILMAITGGQVKGK